MINVTIDDSSPSVTYSPSGAWNARSASIPCSDCYANPDVDRLFENTFHDGTFNPPRSKDFPNVPLTASMMFNGTAVYVFCILAESSTSPDGDSDMSFYIDGSLSGTFIKTAPGHDNVYDYAINVFSIDSLILGLHNLTLQNGHINGTKSLVLLDEIVYTTVNDTYTGSSPLHTLSSFKSEGTERPGLNDLVSSTENLSVIIGPAVAVPLVVLLLSALGIFLFRKRRKRQQHQGIRSISDSSEPTIANDWVIEPTPILPSHSVAASSSGVTPSPSPYQNLNSNVEPDRTYHNKDSTAVQSSSSEHASPKNGSTSGGTYSKTHSTTHSHNAPASFLLVDVKFGSGEAPPAYSE